MCHEADGSGGVGVDLRESRLPAEEVVWAIVNGGETMPPWGDVLSVEQIRAVAAYVETFRN